jgi:hypothetical protein
MTVGPLFGVKRLRPKIKPIPAAGPQAAGPVAWIMALPWQG